MSYKNQFALILLFSSFINGQDFEPLQALRSMINPESYIEKQAESHSYKKCGFEIVSDVMANFNSYKKSEQEEIQLLLSRPIAHKSVVTPSGNFTIHYDTSGINSVGYNLTELMKAIDSAYYYETTILGFPAAPNDYGDGGSSNYDIYIKHLGSSLYGYTVPEYEIQSGSSKYVSYMVIENDFAGFYTEGINGAKVTVAHEYHHAIQIGNYIYRYSDDGFYYEITSTAMEEFVFDDVNDYYAYIPDYFENPEGSLGSYSGYELAMLNIFLKEKYGSGIIRSVWEYMPSQRALYAINSALNDIDTDFKSMFAEFAEWLYFTEYRYNSEYFEEGAIYPLLRPFTIVEYSSPKVSVQAQVKAVSINMINFPTPSLGTSDTISAVIVNSNIDKGLTIQDFSINYSFSYNIQNYYEQGSYPIISNIVYSKISNISDDLILNTTDFNYIIYNGSVLNADNSFNAQNNIVFPQPFKYNSSTRETEIYIPLNKKADSEFVDFNLYSVSMELVYTKSKRVELINGVDGYIGYYIKWDGLTESGNRLPTGVYFYALQVNNDAETGKIVIQNE